VLVLLIGLATAACESTSAPRPALQLDVARYIARVQQWAPAEREASAAIAEIFRSHFVDADLATSVANRILPAIDRHVQDIATYAPTTPEISEIHGRYAAAWQRLREGFELIYDGMKADDGIRLARGRSDLEMWSEEMIAVANQLRKLAEAVGVSRTKSASRQIPRQGKAA